MMQPRSSRVGTQASRVGQQHYLNTGNGQIGLVQHPNHYRGSPLTQHNIIQFGRACSQLHLLRGCGRVVGCEHVHCKGDLDAHIPDQEATVPIGTLIRTK